MRQTAIGRATRALEELNGAVGYRVFAHIPLWLPNCSVLISRGNIKMKPSTKDQIEGTLHDMKGKLKEKAGTVTDNPKLTAEGQSEKLTGKVQKKVGQIEKVLEK